MWNRRGRGRTSRRGGREGRERALDLPDRDVGAVTAAAGDRDPEAGLRVQGGYRVAVGAAFLGPVTVRGAGGADAGDAVRRAGAGAVAAVQAAAAVPHRRLPAVGARAGAGTAAWGEGGIAGRLPILQAVAPRGMGFYRRQRGLLRAGKA
jgi:hypothetical protein